MAILIDPPRWPAHGTVFCHLVSDTSLEELHTFAAAAGIPPRAFDHDHYDVPERRYADLVGQGAHEVSENELVRRLIAGGLRVRRSDRTPTRGAALPILQQAWTRLMPNQDTLGADLIERWSEPHRRYHDVRHLAQCLTALAAIEATEPVADAVRLAAWFHDAVYQGVAGTDEEASAQLATTELARAGLDGSLVAEVARLVRLTVDHAPAPGDHNGSQLVDADLSILGVSRARYHVYVRDVREEYADVTDQDFRTGRLAVVERLLALDPLFHTQVGETWTAAAHRNLTEERLRYLS